MMKDQELINMEINIGGEPIKLSVPFQDQELIRTVEDEINGLYATWRRNFPKRSEKGILAMMIYRYASYYKKLSINHQEAIDIAAKCLENLESSMD